MESVNPCKDFLRHEYFIVPQIR